MRHLNYVLGVFLVSMIFLSACSEKKDEVAINNKSVALLKLGSHEIIDMVESSIKKELGLKYSDKITIRIYNANFDNTLLDQSSMQLVDRNFDVLVPITTSASIALANQLKPNQKMIFSFVSLPESIWGETNQKPNNITGTSDRLDYENNLILIKKMFPKTKTIAYLVNASEENARDGLKQVKQFAKKHNLKILEVNVNDPSDVANAARTVVMRSDVFLVGGDNTVVSALGSLLNIAIKHKKPVFAVENTSVKQGCIAAYGIDYEELGKATAAMIIKVLEGTPIEDLDINNFSKVKLYMNKDMIDFYDINISKFHPEKIY